MRTRTFVLCAMFLLISPLALSASTEEHGKKPVLSDRAVSMAFIGAAVAVGLGSLAAGIAVGLTGSSAIGAMAEKPELMGKLLIIIGLAEGIAIYGLIMGIMIIGKI